MVKEIYIRDPEDPYYNDNVLDFSNPIESIISKLRMIFSTTQGDVLGDMDFGFNLEEYVFTTRLNGSKIEEKIKQQIYLYISESTMYDVQPKISFGKTQFYDYAILDIYINGRKTIGFSVR